MPLFIPRIGGRGSPRPGNGLPRPNPSVPVMPNPNVTLKSAQPTKAPWTVESLSMWAVIGFYIAVIAAAAVYFIKRWRRRTYGAGSSTQRSATSREERAALRGDAAAGDAGFLAVIGAMIDRVMNRAALEGAAVWQDATRHRSSSGPGSRQKPGAGSALLRRLAPFLPGAQGRAARRSRDKPEEEIQVVELEAGGGGAGRPDGSPSGRQAAMSSPPPGADVSVVPSAGMPSTMTARDPAH